jgi:hypothetical protein
VNDVLRKFPQLTITHVTKEAGFPTPMAVKTEGLPNNACLLWIVFGRSRNKAYKWQHVTSVLDEAAANLYRQLLPGFTKLRMLSALPNLPKWK